MAHLAQGGPGVGFLRMGMGFGQQLATGLRSAPYLGSSWSGHSGRTEGTTRGASMIGPARTVHGLSSSRLAGWFIVGVLVACFALWSQLRTVDGDLGSVLRVGSESGTVSY